MTLTVLLLFFALPLAAAMGVRALGTAPGPLRLLLSFSGSFLLGVVFLHMLPELYESQGEGVGLWILAGFLLQVVLEFFSKGIEHGHMHGGEGGALPWITLVSLCIHSFVEGMPFADPDVAGNRPFLAGVLLHKLPMAIALASVVGHARLPPPRAWAMLLIFALAAPLGIGVGLLVGTDTEHRVLHGMLGLAIGMLLHIGTTIIFESAPGHRFHGASFIAVIIGAALAMLSVH